MSEKTQEIELSEVKQHSTPEDCWVAVNNKVYDVTDFLGLHPGGGESIEAEAGTEATKAYDFVGHSTYAHSLMALYQIGVLPQTEKVTIKEPPKKTSTSCCTIL